MAASADRRMNVVVIVSDDHGLDAGCYGNPVLRTPHMDALAADGVRFTSAFCTAATCSPSRSVILSGIYSHSNGMYGLAHSFHHYACFDNLKTLPVRMEEVGYRTGRVGKFHVAPESVFRFQKFLPGHIRSPVEMADNCREFMAEDGPFFLYYCTGDPHRCGNTAADLPGKPNCFGNRSEGYPGVEEVRYDHADVVVPSFLPDTVEVRAELAQYYQSVSRMDQGIGRLVRILRELGKYDNTLIIYVSDNGSAFPESKTTLYEPGLRLPCIVRAPGETRRGGTCDAMVNWADLTPTILDFAGAKIEPDAFQGRSFREAMTRERPEGWDEVYASHCLHEATMYYPMRVVRTRRHKFIWNIASALEYPFASDLWGSASWQGALRGGLTQFGRRSVAAYLHRPKFELYDLEQDPDEVRNLAADPANAALVAEFCEKIKAFQKRTRDPWIIKWLHE